MARLASSLRRAASLEPAPLGGLQSKITEWRLWDASDTKFMDKMEYHCGGNGYEFNSKTASVKTKFTSRHFPPAQIPIFLDWDRL